ncbi:hypothetical protein ACFYXH_21190 [Streptomyces sp. NPDC002730]|uniref:hypothetical protein n=1 Tax=Streptomyces sp. NPDC002730 TaxID=3364662 RepID=UPI0036B65C74
MTATVVVLADVQDEGAAAVTNAVAARLGGHHVLAVRPADLARARWSQRISECGAVTTRVVLPGGRILDDHGIGAVLHRLPGVPLGAFRMARVQDRAYARAELNALVAAWLLGLAGRVVGSLCAYGTAPGRLSAVAAQAHASRCGLPVVRHSHGAVPAPQGPTARPLHVTRSGRLLVVGADVVGSLAERYGTACRRLAGRLGTDLLEVRFTEAEMSHVAADVDLRPPLDQPEHASAVADLLIGLAERTTPGGPR